MTARNTRIKALWPTKLTKEKHEIVTIAPTQKANQINSNNSFQKFCWTLGEHLQEPKKDNKNHKKLSQRWQAVTGCWEREKKHNKNPQWPTVKKEREREREREIPYRENTMVGAPGRLGGAPMGGGRWVCNKKGSWERERERERERESVLVGDG
jgi:hypothetical protein